MHREIIRYDLMVVGLEGTDTSIRKFVRHSYQYAEAYCTLDYIIVIIAFHANTLVAKFFVIPALRYKNMERTSLEFWIDY